MKGPYLTSISAWLPHPAPLCSVAAARFAAYSQLEVVRTGMLGRHIKAGGARVLQLGGTTRDLFYLPKGTQQVTVAGADVRVSLWEQAGMQAGGPVRAVRTGNEEGQLGFMAGGSVDSVVAFDQLGAGAAAAAALLAEVWRVLKPGGTFVFVQRIDGSPVAALLRLGSGPAAGELGAYARSNQASLLRAACCCLCRRLSRAPCTCVRADPGVADVVGEAQPWDYMQWDLAVPSLDPHAVGVAVKPLAAAAPPGAGAGGAASVDKTAFEQVLRSKARTGAGPKAGKRKGFGGQ
jgi:SAM-dependent methyltransferase